MPRDVVRLPGLSTAPVARIAGSFSFEEGGAVLGGGFGPYGCGSKNSGYPKASIILVKGKMNKHCNPQGCSF